MRMDETHLTRHLSARFQLFWPFCSRILLSAVRQKWVVPGRNGRTWSD